MRQFIVQPGGIPQGDVRVASDKSISHRAVMFGALAEGRTRVSELLEGEDVLATIAAFRAMGVAVNGGKGSFEIDGVGLRGLKQPAATLDMGNSGTACRLLAGILAGQPWQSIMSGDSSLNGRPMGRIIKPLSEMGADIASSDGCPPLHINGKAGNRLNGIQYDMPIASAQVKSAILLAGLYAAGETRIREPRPTRDHTERMLRGFGYGIEHDGEWISMQGGGHLTATDIVVPADLSSATFFLLAAAITPGAMLTLPGVGVNPSRSGVIPVLQRMGASLTLENPREIGGEPVADLHMSGATLSGIQIDAQDVALAVDEIPSIAVAAACADGVTRISGAEELRVKESDRIATTVSGLRALGIAVDEHPDGMTITGGSFSGGVVESHGDHRIAMAFSMAGTVASGPVTINNVDCVGTSFPGFESLCQRVGLRIALKEGT